MLKLFWLLLGSTISAMLGFLLGVTAAGLSAHIPSAFVNSEMDTIASIPLLATALITWLLGTLLTVWVVYRRPKATDTAA